jgi:uncharacterized phage protein gp47/JayE
MFENKTYEVILKGLLRTVTDKDPDIDTRTGSLIYTALAPVALELESVYRTLDMTLMETFLETASMEYLVKHGKQIGIEPLAATSAHFKGKFNVEVPRGARFNSEAYNYQVLDKLSDPTASDSFYYYELVCETAGKSPNNYLGEIKPITYVPNLQSAELVSVLTLGEDEEGADSYRYRLQVHVNNPPVDGNVAQYGEWLSQYRSVDYEWESSDIGKYKVIPCWNGLNTVKLMITNSEDRAANDTLLKDVQNHFDPPTEGVAINDDTTDPTYPQGRGMGNGQAPIGAIVTVTTVTEQPVSISCKLFLKNGYKTPVGVATGIQDYLDSIAFENSKVAYMPIAAAIYNAESVGDVEDLVITVKGVQMSTDLTPFVESVTLEEDELAVLNVPTDGNDWSKSDTDDYGSWEV